MTPLRRLRCGPCPRGSSQAASSAGGAHAARTSWPSLRGRRVRPATAFGEGAFTAEEECGGDHTVVAQTHWRHAVLDVLSGRRKSKGGDDSARRDGAGRDSARCKSSARGSAATPKKVAKRWQSAVRRASVQAREVADETRFQGPAGDDAIDNEFLVAAVAQDLLGDTPYAKQLAESYARSMVARASTSSVNA